MISPGAKSVWALSSDIENSMHEKTTMPIPSNLERMSELRKDILNSVLAICINTG